MTSVEHITMIQGCGNTMFDLSSLSHFSADKEEISIYLSLGNDFIALSKKSVQIMNYTFFSYFSRKICCVYSLEEPH